MRDPVVPEVNAPPPAGSVALYWDFENLHAGLVEAADPGAYARPDTRFKVQEPLVDLPAVLPACAGSGAPALSAFHRQAPHVA